MSAILGSKSCPAHVVQGLSPAICTSTDCLEMFTRRDAFERREQFEGIYDIVEFLPKQVESDLRKGFVDEGKAQQDIPEE